MFNVAHAELQVKNSANMQLLKPPNPNPPKKTAINSIEKPYLLIARVCEIHENIVTCT